MCIYIYKSNCGCMYIYIYVYTYIRIYLYIYRYHIERQLHLHYLVVCETIRVYIYTHTSVTDIKAMLSPSPLFLFLYIWHTFKGLKIIQVYICFMFPCFWRKQTYWEKATLCRTEDASSFWTGSAFDFFLLWHWTSICKRKQKYVNMYTCIYVYMYICIYMFELGSLWGARFWIKMFIYVL